MKTLFRIAVSIALTYALLTLTSCDTSSKTKQETSEINYEHEREEIADDLNKLKEDLNQRISVLDDQMENASDEAKEELREAGEELKQARENVNQELDKLEKSTEKTWSDIRKGARNTFQDVKRELNELGDRLADKE